MCTFVGCPIGSCVGCGVAIAQEIDSRTKRALKLALFGAIFAAGLICYLILSVLCARADHDHWTLLRDEGECWSEGGTMPYMDFGQWTGVLMGVGFFGTLVMCIRMHIQARRQNPIHDSLGPTSSVPEQTEDVDVEHGHYDRICENDHKTTAQSIEK